MLCMPGSGPCTNWCLQLYKPIQLLHHQHITCVCFNPSTLTCVCVSLLMLSCDAAAIVVFGLQILENGSLPGITG
jgi:hypothetical protein